MALYKFRIIIIIISVMLMLYVVGLTRESSEAQLEFDRLDGFSVLLRAMQSDVEKLQTKSAFLVSALCQQQPSFKSLSN